MTVALSGTADPADLIPGSVEAVRRDADDLAAQAGDLERIGAAIARRSIESWESSAADGYTTRRGELSERLATLGQIYRWVAETLHCYADVLAWGQRRAASAVIRYATSTPQPVKLGSFGVVGGPQQVQPAPPDPFGRPVVGPLRPGAVDAALIREQAESDLADARTVVAQAEAAAAAALDRLTEGLPDGKCRRPAPTGC